MISEHKIEIQNRKRFSFGKNWDSLLKFIDKNRIEAARQSLLSSLRLNSLEGMRFLDIACGSGLFSLAAYSLGAKVTSFDYDPISVECAKTLKQKYYPEVLNWNIEEGSVLNESYLKSLGDFDIVYSWGVLHHTGDMWKALENLHIINFNYLFIAIYNDQGLNSIYWHFIKRKYNSNILLKILIIIIHWPYLFLFRLIKSKVQSKVLVRGMNIWIDMLDWLGGIPFEVASPEKIIHFFYKKNLICSHLKTCRGRFGCNEFVLVKENNNIS